MATKITVNSLADSAVTSAKIANTISVGTLSVSGNTTIPSIIGNTSFSNNAEVLGSLTVNGQTQLQEQSITSKNSAITQGLLGMAAHANQSDIGANGLWSAITTLQAGTHLATNNAGLLRIDSADAVNFGSITVNMGTFSGIGNTSPFSNRDPNFNFSQRFGFSFFIRSGGDTFNAAVQSWAFAVGTYDSISSHSIESLYPLTQTTAGYRGYVCVTCINGEVVLRVKDKNINRVDSAVLETISVPFSRNYAVIVEGGVAYLYREGVLLGSVSGASQYFDLNGASAGVFFHNSSNAIGSNTRRQMRLYNGKAWW